MSLSYETRQQGSRVLLVPRDGHTEGMMRWALPDGLWLVQEGQAALSLPDRDVPDFLTLLAALETTP